jgi:cation transport protein ChaC
MADEPRDPAAPTFVPEPGADMWVFGYGSLMWRPGFSFAECVPARLAGWHRALCVYSHLYRGTAAAPGLVLGLDRGGSCRGVAFRVRSADAGATLAYLRDRELVSYVYRELVRPVEVAGGSRVPAVLYAADRAHAQYAGALTRAKRLALVARGVGVSGTNRDYVLNTLAHLDALGVHDPELTWIAAHLPPLTPSPEAAG